MGLLTSWLAPLEQAQAIQASPIPIRLRQPDGTEVLLRIKGDAIFNWYEDMEGRTVLREGKSYVYAQLDAAGWLAPTRLLAGRDDPRASGIRPGVFPSRAAVRAFRQQVLLQGMSGASMSALSAGGPPPQGINPVGTVKNLVVLCRFSDHDDTKTRAREDYDAVFNNVGGHATLAPTGSVRDYFTEASYGTVTLASTVVAWVTLPNTEAYYANGQNGIGTNSYPNNAQRMVFDALNLVDPLVNFGDFDMDNDGFIDAITIIHSGYAAETGGGAGNWIWSHKWALWAVPGGRWTSADLNGSGVNVKVYDYHTEAALWGTSGTGITRIGVICHETGHFFGLPDLYDTDGSSEGIGSWCLMANSWGFDFSQQKPPHFSAWCKQQLGWVTPTVITPGTYDAPRVALTPTVYKITSGYPAGEYLLVENRQPYGMESIMPQGGLCVWHIDDTKVNNNQEGHPWQAGWPANGNHYKVALLQADGLYEMERGMNRGNAGDVYHGGGASQITPSTVPNTHRYQGGTVQATNNALSGISAAGAVMSFTYTQAAIPAITSALTADGTTGTPFSYQITATNNPTSFSATGLPAGLSVNTATGLISGTPAVVGSFNVGLGAANAEGAGAATLVLAVLPPVVHSFDLDTDPGWARQGEWAYGTPAGGGGVPYGRPDPTSGATGTRVFGINLAGNYSTTQGVAQYLTTGPLDLRGRTGVTLRFKRWLNADFHPYTAQTVQVSRNGINWTTAWQNSTAEIADSAWTTVSYDISAVADDQPVVYLRWGHQITASGAWAYSGWNLDDVQILGAANARLTLALPATVQEGAEPVNGTVTAFPVPASDVLVTLSTTHGTRLALPPSVTIPAGQASATFILGSAVDNLLNGSPRVEVRATAQDYGEGTASTRVVDAQSAVLTVTLPAQGLEGEEGLTGTVSVSAPVAEDVMITLLSSDAAELDLPAEVEIPAGGTEAEFPLTLLDDAALDGDQTVTVTAQVAGWTSGSRSMRVVDVGVPEFYTEVFDEADAYNDTAGFTYTFTPRAGGGYTPSRHPAVAFPTPPAGGSALVLSDDSFQTITLGGAATVPFFGVSHASLHVGSNGYVTFGAGDGSAESTLSNHFSKSRVAALLADLDPGSQGSVSWRQLADRVAVTWQNVPEYGTAHQNDFQIELFFDGRIAITILSLDALGGLIGLSPGLGVPPDFVESDFSSYPMPTMELVLPAFATEGDGLLSGMVRLDAAVAEDTLVQLASSNPGEALVPATVTILAGEMEAELPVTVVDDALLDGTQQVVITATLPGYPQADIPLRVRDNETATLSLALPASLAEGQPAGTGTVTISAPAGRDVRVVLATDLPERLILPEDVVVPAGQSSATFPMQAVDNALLEGTTTAQVTADVLGWSGAEASQQVLDDENKPMLLVLPEELMEGETAEGRVILGGPAARDFFVELTHESGRLSVDGMAYVPVGASETTFFVSASDFGVEDEADELVTLTAQAEGMETGLGQLRIVDGTLHELVLSPVQPTQQAGVPFALTVTAKGRGGRVLRGYVSALSLSAAGVQGPIPLNTSGAGDFVQGVWSGQVVVEGLGTQVVLRAVQGSVEGLSSPFDVSHGPLHHFDWELAPGQKVQDAPFAATVTARDRLGNLVSGHSGGFTLSAHAGGSPGLVRVLAYTGFADMEVGYPRTVQAVATHFPGFELETLTGQPSDSALAAALAGKDVFLVPEQPRAALLTLLGLGTSWAAPLAAFVNAGGTLVVCSHEGYEHLIPQGAGLITVIKGPQLPSTQLSVVSRSVLTAGLADSFTARNMAPWASSNGQAVLARPNGQPAVLRRDVGQGRVVLIGTTFADTSPELGRVAANAVALAKLELPRLAVTPHAVPAMVGGSWTGQVRVRQAAASAFLRASAGMVLGESGVFSVQQVHFGPSLIALTAAGHALESGVSTLAAGAAEIGAAAPDLSLTLRNVTLSTTLTLGAITITGAHAADFTLDRTATAASLAGGAETAVVIRFTPRGPGARTAQLSIASNSVADQPLVIPLSGTGMPAVGPVQQVVVGDTGPRRPADGAFDLNAYSTSGLPLAYEVLAGPATVDATGRVTPTGGSGAVTVRITQPGGGGYGAAERLVTFALGTWPRFVRVFGGQNASATFALREDGTLWTWGYAGTTGYLGDSTGVGRITPTQVGSVTTWVDVAVGNGHAVGRRSDGTLWAWGLNSSSQLGDNSTINRTAPVQIGSGRSWARVAAGTSHSVSVASDGTLWAWGLNSSSQLGLGDTTTRTVPTQIGTASNWSRVACGGSFTVALRADGTLWAWGSNGSGQLGDGTTTTRSTPVQVGTATDWAAVSCGSNYVLAQKTTGELWAWGSGASGQLGNGSTASQNVPVQVSAERDWVSFSCGSFTCVARKQDGSLWCWGSNLSGQLGDGTRTNRSRPQRFATGTDWGDICASAEDGCVTAVRADGLLFTAGEQYGFSGVSPRSLTFGEDTAGTEWTSLSGNGTHFTALRADGTLWAWGQNGNGQLGDGTTTHRRVLTQVGMENQWAQVAAGSHFFFSNATMAVKKNGSLWGWGTNTSYQLGDGTISNRSSPVQIGTATDWKQVACGQVHGMGVRTGGTLWGWGTNGSSQLGDGSTTTRTAPVQVGSATNWSTVSCGLFHSAAIRTDGTLWAWGLNSSGQLGDGTTTNRTAPVQIGPATDWSVVVCGGNHTLALKTNGTLWATGLNSLGQLGLGDTMNRLSFTQVGSLTGWTRISASRNTSAALRSDGTLWTSGENHSGQVGNGSTTNRLTLTQVGRQAGFQQVAVGALSLAAIRADGTFWTAGAASQRVLAAGRSRTTVSPVLPVLTSQVMVPPAPSYPAWQAPIRLFGTSGLPAQVRVLSGPAAAGGGGILPTGAGTVTVLAWQPGDERAWDAAPPEQFSFTVGNDITATLTAGGGPLVSAPAFDASGVALNLALGFAPGLGQELVLVDNTGAGPVTGQFPGLALPGWIVLVHEGVRYGFRIRYDGGDGNDITLVHEVAPQVILAGGITPKAATDAAFSPGATSSSGLPVQLQVVTGPATVSGGLVSLTGLEGAVTLRLTQPGNAQFLPATPLIRTFRIAQGAFRFTRVSTSRTGSHTLAVMADGSLWAWGTGTSGRIGDGTTTSRFVPVRVGTALDWQQVSAGGSHSAGIRAGGALWAWGLNSSGQVGDGTTTNRSSPVQVTGNWAQVSAGNAHMAAIRADGTLWAWGGNASGQVGDGTTTNRSSPVQVGTDTNWAAVSCGLDFTLALKTNGTLWGWGNNGFGQVGNGAGTNQTTPAQIGTATHWKSICAGGYHAVAVRLDGSLWAWGWGGWGSLGLGDTANRNTPVRVGTGSDWLDVEAGNGQTVARRADGSLWTCGLNNSAQLGLGDQTNRLTLERVAPGTAWAGMSCGGFMTYALAADGTLHGWGDGIGSHGLSARTLTRSLPARAGGWAEMSLTGAHAMLRTPEGTLWAQGLNNSGQLGAGDTTPRSALVQVGVLDDWTQVSAGGSHTLALREDGSLWAWGGNGSGQVGDGTTTSRSSPLRIGADSDWTYVSAANSHSFAIKQNGTLWGWGLNLNSQLGDGTTTNRTSLVQIGTDGGWVAVAGGSFHSLGLKSDGTLWAWGFNGNGQLGDGTTTSRTSPVQVGTATDWAAVHAGTNFSAALRLDGSLWTWGLNVEGQLGSGTTSSRSSPGRVGTANDWTQVACGTNAMAALRADGSLWVWGGGAAGQLGEGNAANALTPRRVGNGTGWVAVQAGETCLAALQADGSLWTAGMTGGFRLGAASGRSAFAIAPVLPALFPQTLEQVPQGGGVRITASSGMPVSLSLLSGQALLADGLVTPTGGPGATVRVLAWQPGDDTAWDAAQPVEVVLTRPAGQLLVMEGGEGGPEVDDATLVDFGTASPGVPVLRTFTVKNIGLGTLNLRRLSTSAGLSWQVLTQDMRTMLAPDEATSFTVAFQSVLGGLSQATVRVESDDPAGPATFQVRGISRFAQGITFAAIPEQECGTPLDMAGLATSTSGLPVVLEVSAGADVASLSGQVLVFHKAGAVTLRASQAGGGLFAAAPSVSRTIQVRRGPQVLAFAPGLPASISHRGTVALAATSSRGLAPVTFRVVGGPGQLTGSSLGFTGPGSVVVEAAQAGDAAFLPATAELSILSTNAAPAGLPQSLTTPDSVPLPLTLAGLDGDGDPLVFTLVDPPAHGTLAGAAPALTYLSAPGYAGPDSFTFKVWDGFAESAPVLVEIAVSPVAPALVGSAPPVVVNPGGRAVLQVPHTGSRPLSYQWWKGTQQLEGRTDSTLVIDPAQEADEGAYTVVISNSVASITSGAVLLSVNDPVRFTTQPLSQAVGELNDVELSVQTTGTGPITYQWFHGNVPLPAATGRTLALTGITAAQAGSYHVVATNPVGSVPSDPAVLDVVGATPRITQQPAHQMLHSSGVLSLEVAALGRRPLTYQWRLNGRNLAGATGPRLEWHNVGTAQAGKYTVLVSTPAGSRLSEVAEVGVVVNQPARQTLAENAGTTLRVTSAGNGLTHTWTRQGADMPPTTRARPSTDGKSLVFTRAQSEDSGTYHCLVGGPGGSLPGGTVTLAFFDTAPDLVDDQQMPPAIIGSFYTHQIRLNGSGGSTPSTYSVQNLPPGLTVNAQGLISGRPTQATTRSVRIRASNRHGFDETTATLLVKPFPTGLAGTYTGIVARNAALNQGLGGRLDLTLSAQGSVSGRLTLGGLPPYTLTGALTLDASEVEPPRLQLTLPRTGTPTPPPLRLELAFDTGPGTTTPGSRVYALAEEASIEAWLSPWKAGSNPCAYPGFHTFALRRTAEDFTHTTVPHGHGYGSFTVTAAGTTTLTGRTADGEPFTSASPMGGQGQLALFSLQYPAPGRGSLRGIIQVSGGARADTTADNLVDGSLDWSRPDKRPRGGVVYPAGFGPISLQATGGAYLPPTRHLGLPSGLDITRLTFAGGGVASSQIQPDTGITLDYLNRISPGTPNFGIIALRSTTALATFSGDFTLNDPHWQKPAPARWVRKVPFQGMIIHRAGLYWGAGYYLLPAMPTADPVRFPPLQLSGRVLWQRSSP